MRSILAAGLGLLLVAASADAQLAGVNLREMFVRLDANGDQVIEKSEVPDGALPAFEKLLAVADTNKDGKIEVEEFREMVRGIQEGISVVERFKAMDKDGDGKVSRAEFSGLPARFARVDTNKDGFIDKDEVKAIVGQAQPGAGIMAMDKDGNGKVSRAEFLGQPAVFARLDADSDGQIDKDEASKAAVAMYQRLTGMDTNKDGKLSRDEFKGLPARFDQLDADGDGFVSFEEIRAGGGRAATARSAVKPKAKPKKAP